MKHIYVLIVALALAIPAVCNAGLDSYGDVTRDTVAHEALQANATGTVAVTTGAVTRVNAYKQRGSFTIDLKSSEASDGGTNFVFTVKIQKCNGSTWTDVSGATATLTGTNLTATTTGALDWAGLQTANGAVTYLRAYYSAAGAMVGTNPVSALSFFVRIDGYK